jgi:hypothetical protein
MFTPLSHCELGLCGLDFLLGFEINEGNYIAALLCLLHVTFFPGGVCIVLVKSTWANR